jgi:hypothetical protein
MNSIKKKGHIKLRKALAAAYREKEKVEVGELWQVRVMGRIQDLGSPYPKTSFFELFQRFVWRLAPVACILVLLLGTALTQLNFVSDYEMAEMFIEDPADFSLFALYNNG